MLNTTLVYLKGLDFFSIPVFFIFKNSKYISSFFGILTSIGLIILLIFLSMDIFL